MPAFGRAKQQEGKGTQPPAEAAAASGADDAQEDSESDAYSSSSEGADGGEGSMFGNMKTRLRWQAADRTMHLDVRQYLQNRRKLEGRYKGRLNTSSGHYVHTIQLQRLLSQNTPSLARVMAAERGFALDGEQTLDPTAFLPAGLSTLLARDWVLAPGVRFTTMGRAAQLAPASAADTAAAAPAAAPGAGSDSSSSSVLRYCMTLRKQPQVLLRRGAWDSWLDGKVDVEVEAGGQQQQQRVGLRASARLKVLRLNVTDKQDVQLAVGADYVTAHHSVAALLDPCVRAHLAPAAAAAAEEGGKQEGGGWGLANGVLVPYVRISENSWALRLSKGSLAFTYEM